LTVTDVAWLDPVVQQRLVASLSEPASLGRADPQRSVPMQPDLATPDGLAAREGEVLALIADGLSNAEIG
jgi:DNA-binding NarL/FixJ family response regulator